MPWVWYAVERGRTLSAEQGRAAPHPWFGQRGHPAKLLKAGAITLVVAAYQQTEDLCHAPILEWSRDQIKRVASSDLTFFDDAIIPARAA